MEGCSGCRTIKVYTRIERDWKLKRDAVHDGLGTQAPKIQNDTLASTSMSDDTHCLNYAVTNPDISGIGVRLVAARRFRIAVLNETVLRVSFYLQTFLLGRSVPYHGFIGFLTAAALFQ